MSGSTMVSVAMDDSILTFRPDGTVTQKIADSTAEIVETFGATKKGAQILSAIGRVAMRFGFWLSRFLFIVGSLWAVFHGHWPKGSE